MHKHPGTIVIGPRITEKGAYMSEKGCFVFNVAPSATKKEVVESMRAMFKVTPRKVTLAAIPRKRVNTRSARGTRKPGMTAGGKKAYVFLKKGDTIEIA